MNKTELIAALAAKTGKTKKETEETLDALKGIVVDSLVKGEKIQIVGFGAFDVKDRPARVARNPRTNEEIRIEASKAPVFKPGKELKEAVNQ